MKTKIRNWFRAVARKMRMVKKVEVNLPFGLGKAEVEPDYAEQQVAWILYVELSTRVALQPLDPEHGLLREALASLHSIFTTTRTVLREAGPHVAGHPNSVGAVAIKVLNQGMRPFLAKWHPLLSEWETQREPNASVRQHELDWEKAQEMRDELSILCDNLWVYADALAKIAGVEI
jgi:hypothetical protein